MLTKVPVVKALVFSVLMYWCESWTIKKAECWRIDAFKLWCWRRLLRVPWAARRSNQLILKEISPEYSLERLMLKLKLQYFDAVPYMVTTIPDVKSWFVGKNPDAGKDWGQEKRTTEDEMVGWYHWLNGHEFEQTPGDSDGQGSLMCSNSWGCRESDTTEHLNNKNWNQWNWKQDVSRENSWNQKLVLWKDQ